MRPVRHETMHLIELVHSPLILSFEIVVLFENKFALATNVASTIQTIEYRRLTALAAWASIGVGGAWLGVALGALPSSRDLNR